MPKDLSTIKSSNLAMLEFVARRLDELNNDVVYLGGCATALLINDPLAMDVRATKDVDCIVDVISHVEYNKFEKKLRQKGIKNASQDQVICRWILDDIVLDVMPADEKILGFGNKWYKPAIMHSEPYQLTENITIRSITLPYFLATKLEAFKTRGNNDLFASHDFEDIIAVLAGRTNIIEEIKSADTDVNAYLKLELRKIRDHDDFETVLPGHLREGPISVTMQRVENVKNSIEAIIQG